MPLNPSWRITTLVATIVLLAAVPGYAQQRPITEKDLFSFVWTADPQISPDGSLVAFVRVSADEKKDAYETAIWLARTDGSESPRPDPRRAPSNRSAGAAAARPSRRIEQRPAAGRRVTIAAPCRGRPS